MQPTLIIWGEKDQVFPVELAHRLERHAVPLMLPSEFSHTMFEQPQVGRCTKYNCNVEQASRGEFSASSGKERRACG